MVWQHCPGEALFAPGLPAFPGKTGGHTLEAARLFGGSPVDDSQDARPAQKGPIATRREIVDAVAVAIERVKRLMPAEAVVAEPERREGSGRIDEDDPLAEAKRLAV